MCRILKALFSPFNVDGSFIVLAYVAHISFTVSRDRLLQVATPQRALDAVHAETFLTRNMSWFVSERFTIVEVKVNDFG